MLIKAELGAQVAPQPVQSMLRETHVIIATRSSDQGTLIMELLSSITDVVTRVVPDGETLIDSVVGHRTEIAVVHDEIAGASGFVKRLREANPKIAIIVCLKPDNVAAALPRIRDGAVDCVPDDRLEKLPEIVRSVIQDPLIRHHDFRFRMDRLKQELSSPESFLSILTADTRMFSLFLYIELIATTDAPILITGETGTGKDMIADVIHSLSGRSGHIVKENVASIDNQLVSDALFGHKAGGFTGAIDDNPGLLTQAQDGTLFLDEIGDLNTQLQVKLLRLIEYGEYYPVGSDEVQRSNARFVFATNRDLEQMVDRGEFRVDLFHRLGTHRVKLPPLRERGDDAILLFSEFVARAAVELNRPAIKLSAEAIAILRNYPFPGNVRELRSMAQHVVREASNGHVTKEDFVGFNPEVDDIASSTTTVQDGRPDFSFADELPSITHVTDLLLDEALARANGNKSEAARLIGLSPSAISKRLKRRTGSETK